jgi:hypothetical protein
MDRNTVQVSLKICLQLAIQNSHHFAICTKRLTILQGVQDGELSIKDCANNLSLSSGKTF